MDDYVKAPSSIIQEGEADLVFDFKTAYVFTGGTQGGDFVTAETVVDWNNLGKINVNPKVKVWGIRKYKLTTVYLNENIVSSHAEILPLQ
jgi:hypothetical protein